MRKLPSEPRHEAPLQKCPRCNGEGRIVAIDFEMCVMCGKHFPVAEMEPWNPSETFAWLCRPCDKKAAS